MIQRINIQDINREVEALTRAHVASAITFIVTKHGVDQFRITIEPALSALPEPDLAKRKRAMDSIERLASELPPITHEEIREAIDEGRL